MQHRPERSGLGGVLTSSITRGPLCSPTGLCVMDQILSDPTGKKGQMKNVRIRQSFCTPLKRLCTVSLEAPVALGGRRGPFHPPL